MKRINKKKIKALGVDIGGTDVKMGIGLKEENKQMRLNAFTTTRFPGTESPPEALEMICQELEGFTGQEGVEVTGETVLGISTGALFTRPGGKVTQWPNHPQWNGFPLKERLEERLKLKVVMEDDANCAALAEKAFGSGRDCDNFAAVTIGTGIGCGLILNGGLYSGANGWAGELGHIPVKKNGPPCGCGQKGCLQTLFSGRALLHQAKHKAAAAGFQLHSGATLEDVARSALEGETWANETFTEAGVYLGRALTTLVLLFDLSLIILAGGVTGNSDLIRKALKNNFFHNMNTLGRQLNLKLSQLDRRSGVMGALSLAGQQFSI